MRKMQSFDISYEAFSNQTGEPENMTAEFDVEHGSFEFMFAQLCELFMGYCEENGLSYVSIVGVEEAPYDGEEEAYH